MLSVQHAMHTRRSTPHRRGLAERQDIGRRHPPDMCGVGERLVWLALRRVADLGRCPHGPEMRKKKRSAASTIRTCRRSAHRRYRWEATRRARGHGRPSRGSVRHTCTRTQARTRSLRISSLARATSTCAQSVGRAPSAGRARAAPARTDDEGSISDSIGPTKTKFSAMLPQLRHLRS